MNYKFKQCSFKIKEEIKKITDREKHLQMVSNNVDSVVNSLGTPIDKEIKPLVIGLNCLGVATDGSCGGHNKRGRGYPWVDIHEDFIRYAGLIIMWQNYHDKNNLWILHPWGLNWEISPRDINRPLNEMREDARKFGAYLQQIFLFYEDDDYTDHQKIPLV